MASIEGGSGHAPRRGNGIGARIHPTCIIVYISIDGKARDVKCKYSEKV